MVNIRVTCKVCGCDRVVEAKGPRPGERPVDWMSRVAVNKAVWAHRMHSLLCEGYPTFETNTKEVEA